MIMTLFFLFAVFLITIYFLPTIVASARNHPNIMPIFIINLFLGWTFLVWVVSLAWAFIRIRN